MTRHRYETAGALRAGLPVALLVVLVLAIPFAISGRWGLLGVGFNNDLGLHLAWAEWLRSGFGPAPDAGYPLGPHGLAVATAAVPGIGLGQAFIGEIVAIGTLTGLTAIGALGEMRPARRTIAAAMVAIPYLAASYFAQAAFKETAEALFVLAFAIFLIAPGALPAGTGARLRFVLPPLALAGGIFFSYSFAGIAWPAAILILWSLTIPAVRQALRPRSLLRFLLRPATLLAIAVLAGLAVVLTLVGPFGFAHGFNKVAGSNTYGPVSPLEVLGIWPAANYRLDAVGGAALPGLAGAIAILALLVGVAWWVAAPRADDPDRPRRLRRPLPRLSPFERRLLPGQGADHHGPPRDARDRPPASLGVPLVERDGGGLGGATAGRLRRALPRPSSAPARHGPARLGGARQSAFIAGSLYSSLLVLRDAPVGPAGHGAQLRAFLPIVHGEPVLYAGQDRYAAYDLLGADTHVPLVEFPDSEVSPNPEKPFDTGDAYSPIDFDSFSRGTLDNFPYVVTSRAAWNSQAPPNFKRVATTPSYVLWKRTGPTPEDRHVLLEGTEAGAFAGCASPEIRILLANPGRAGLFPGAVIGSKGAWDEGSVLGTGAETSQTLSLPAGAWNLSIQYFSPFDLTLSAPGFSQPLAAALDGQRPNTISLGNNGQYWPAGRYVSQGGKTKFTITSADASALQSLSGYDGKAYVGELVAVPAKPHKTVPLSQACDRWIDWYEAEEAP